MRRRISIIGVPAGVCLLLAALLACRADDSTSTFTLQVQVRDALSSRPLPHTTVEVFVDHAPVGSARTGANGMAVLNIDYGGIRPLTILATQEEYIPVLLPWTTGRRPVFSSVRLSLFPHNHGDLWLYEDSVLVASKVSGSVSQPSVEFPRSLLKLPGSRNISSVTAHLTVPRPLPGRWDCLMPTVGLLSSKLGYRRVELIPVAMVSAHLHADAVELQVVGPVQITLPLPANTRLRASDAVPAWALDRNTGAWVNRGVGMVKMVEGFLVWSYLAPYLGDWMAAPMPSSQGSMAHAVALDFLSYHSYLLIAILGGTLVIGTGFIAVLLCHCSRCTSKPAKKRRNVTKMHALKRDKTTSIQSGELAEGHSRDTASIWEDKPCPTFTMGATQRDERPVARHTPRHKTSFNIYVEENMVLPTKGGDSNEAALLGHSDGVFFPEGLLRVYGPPEVLSRPGPSEVATQHPGKDQRGLSRSNHNYPSGSAHSQEGWGRYGNSCLESLSVPGTLNEAAGSSSHPQAWFVSLEGKPVAHVRHSIIDLQQRRRGNDNDTSLDSGVDMSEHAPAGRGRAFLELSSSESAHTAAATPEDPALRNILETGGILEDVRDGAETSSAQEDSESHSTPPTRRLRKARDRSKAERPRVSGQARDKRPLVKHS